MTPHQLSALTAYADATHRELSSAVRHPPTHAARAQTLHQVLNGHPAAAISDILGRPRRRLQGIFFSGPQWATLIARALPVDRCDRILDPACGIGDLLLAVARELPLGPTLQDTLQAWSVRLAGSDLHASFLELAWLRLQALAMERHGMAHPRLQLATACPTSFRVANALKESWALRAGDGLVMNPPFQAIAAPRGTVTSAGRVTAALPFLERAVGHAPPGIRVVALVPEVLRSGSRYGRLRDWLSQRCDGLRFEAHGLFSEEANIDVALLVATTRAPSSPKGTPVPLAAPTMTFVAEPVAPGRRLGDVCTVRVGAVVPHRTLKNAPRQPYIAVADISPWTETTPRREAGYRATAHKPPFVAVRRTSGPKDKERIRATVVKGKQPILVENHLLVLKPHKDTLAACRELMEQLRQPHTHDWLNQRIRCRHLTVGAVCEIPLP